MIFFASDVSDGVALTLISPNDKEKEQW
jgi:hypothetical protein